MGKLIKNHWARQLVLVTAMGMSPDQPSEEPNSD